MAFFCFVPIVALAAGVGSLTPGGWEERYIRLFGNAYGLPIPDSFRPITARFCGEFIVEIESREDFKKRMDDPYIEAVYRRLSRRFAYEIRLAREKKNGSFEYALRPLDSAALEIGGQDRGGEFNTPNYQDPEHPSALYGGLRLDHQIALEDIFAFDLAESATGQWMPQREKDQTDGRVFVEKLNATIVYYNIMLSVGRDRIAWGYGRNGDLILSDNAGPFDALRLQAHRPFKLPWYFSYLGAWHPQVFLARIRGNRNDHDRPYLLGMRCNWAPWPWIEGSIARTMMFLGEGRPGMSAGDFANALVGKQEHTYGGPSDTNGLFEVDVRLHLGFLKQWIDMGSLALYYEFGSESFTRDYSKAYVTGNILGFAYDDTRWGLWGEWADTLHDQVAWYSHYVYIDGYTQEGKIIGHPVGPFGRDYAAGTWFFATPDIEIDLEGGYTTHAGNKGLDEDRRIRGQLGLNLFLSRGFNVKVTGGYAKTDVTHAKQATEDIFGRVMVEWNYFK
jgi:hypothetical protein